MSLSITYGCIPFFETFCDIVKEFKNGTQPYGTIAKKRKAVVLCNEFAPRKTKNASAQAKAPD